MAVRISPVTSSFLLPTFLPTGFLWFCFHILTFLAYGQHHPFEAVDNSLMQGQLLLLLFYLFIYKFYFIVRPSLFQLEVKFYLYVNDTPRPVVAGSPSPLY